MKATTILYASLATLAAAAPTPTINKRATTSDCAQYGSTTASPYVISNDLWGEDNGSGSQCYSVSGVSDGSLSWGTTWSWANNPDDVKSYANAILDFTPTKLSGVTSLTSSWDWSYTGDSIVADVSYDLFTNSVASTSNEEYEIMIWLGRFGTAGPIASSYNAAGNPVSIASTTVAGHAFDLYKGSNGIQTATYSFVATSNITSFSGDINDFLTYLVKEQSFDDSQYLVSIGAGTEAFTGSNAAFKTSAYSISFNGGGSSSSSGGSSSSAAASSMTSSSTASSSAAPSATSVVAASSSSAPSSAAPSATSVAAASSSSAAATSVAAASTSAAASPPGYQAPSSAATSVAAVSTSAAASSSAAAPTATGGSGACEIKYVYV